jgi:hypothetical protein
VAGEVESDAVGMAIASGVHPLPLAATSTSGALAVQATGAAEELEAGQGLWRLTEALRAMEHREEDLELWAVVDEGRALGGVHSYSTNEREREGRGDLQEFPRGRVGAHLRQERSQRSEGRPNRGTIRKSETKRRRWRRRDLSRGNPHESFHESYVLWLLDEGPVIIPAMALNERQHREAIPQTQLSRPSLALEVMPLCPHIVIELKVLETVRRVAAQHRVPTEEEDSIC